MTVLVKYKRLDPQKKEQKRRRKNPSKFSVSKATEFNGLAMENKNKFFEEKGWC